MLDLDEEAVIAQQNPEETIFLNDAMTGDEQQNEAGFDPDAETIIAPSVYDKVSEPPEQKRESQVEMTPEEMIASKVIAEVIPQDEDKANPPGEENENLLELSPESVVSGEQILGEDDGELIELSPESMLPKETVPQDNENVLSDEDDGELIELSPESMLPKETVPQDNENVLPRRMTMRI
ncbi:MAG: hypothetical protein B6245_11695 [Desulfobacteraceae bacterium 4572_88]|nr:MAG: hypothetical protein B6245_11695 [Desulfobacteraceae bacterium 4572_88]